MKKGILNAKELAYYISDYYNSKFSKDISPIKLQKSLYFCFAYWGGFVRKYKLNKSEWLFNEDIEAWVYGPVVPEVYHVNIEDFKNKTLFINNEDVQEFINGVLDDILGVSDFKLIEVSYSDNCWKNNFDINNKRHNNVIDKEDIITEYANMTE